MSGKGKKKGKKVKTPFFTLEGFDLTPIQSQGRKDTMLDLQVSGFGGFERGVERLRR